LRCEQGQSWKKFWERKLHAKIYWKADTNFTDWDELETGKVDDEDDDEWEWRYRVLLGFWWFADCQSAIRQAASLRYFGDGKRGLTTAATGGEVVGGKTSRTRTRMRTGRGG
jgi:hypothetical protein